MIAICAMILPGISGSFILLILGKYLYVTGALKSPFGEGQLTILVIFGLGAMVGITLFSRVLGFLLRRYSDATIALLTGFMIGAMRKIWPWQEVLREEVIGDKRRVLETQNVLPQVLDAEVLLAVALASVGFAVVLVLERLARSEVAS
jgi:putative membrane protein